MRATIRMRNGTEVLRRFASGYAIVQRRSPTARWYDPIVNVLQRMRGGVGFRHHVDSTWRTRRPRWCPVLCRRVK